MAASDKTVDPAVFGQNLRRLRAAAALSQADLAQRVNAATGGWGNSGTQIARFERGLHRPQPRTVAALATALGCTPTDLLEPAAARDEREACARIADQYAEESAANHDYDQDFREGRIIAARDIATRIRAAR
mgnify:CR=1 FL=1